MPSDGKIVLPGSRCQEHPKEFARGDEERCLKIVNRGPLTITAGNSPSIPRVQRRCFRERLLRFGGLPLSLEGASELVIGWRVVGSELDGLLELGDGGIHVSGVEQPDTGVGGEGRALKVSSFAGELGHKLALG